MGCSSWTFPKLLVRCSNSMELMLCAPFTIQVPLCAKLKGINRTNKLKTEILMIEDTDIASVQDIVLLR